MGWETVLNNRFGFANAKVEAIALGEENNNYKVSHAQSQFILRVYSQEHSTTGKRHQAQIEQEHRFISHLADSGVPTPRPLIYWIRGLSMAMSSWATCFLPPTKS